jgi:5-methylcytosine-specific restriction protein A
MSRREFPASVRRAAYKRCNGVCEVCGSVLMVGKFEFDHIIPDGLGGEPTLDNCRVACSACHAVKTHTEDRPRMAKADRQRAKHLGLHPPSRAKIPSRGFPKTRSE